MLNTAQWSTIQRLVAWLDDQNGSGEQEITLRLLKLTEEAGEVAQAWIGVTGQNPRKGRTHSSSDVADELCDVMVTAAVALASLVPDPAAVLDAKLAKIAARSGVSPSSAGPLPPALADRTEPRADVWPQEIQDRYRKRALQWGAAELLVTAARDRGETELDIDEVAEALGLDNDEETTA